MIYARFFINEGYISGFEVKGHSGTAERGRDIVCAAVSSAAYMTANTVTEVLGIDAEASVSDGYMLLRLPENTAEYAESVLKGFKLHMRNLAADYPRSIKIIYGGKKDA